MKKKNFFGILQVLKYGMVFAFIVGYLFGCNEIFIAHEEIDPAVIISGIATLLIVIVAFTLLRAIAKETAKDERWQWLGIAIIFALVIATLLYVPDWEQNLLERALWGLGLNVAYLFGGGAFVYYGLINGIRQLQKKLAQ